MSTPFKETLKSDKFIVTAEAGPPKGANIQKLTEDIELVKDKVDALNVTDNQSAVMRYASVGGSLLVKEHGGEPIFQVTCRDRNRLAIQSDLLFAHSRGINNVLCLTGDSLIKGDDKGAKPVFDLDSVQLIQLVHALNSGKDVAGNDLDGAVDFCIGSCVTPSASPVEPEFIKFERKIAAGIDFVQTQAIYDIDTLKRFMEYARKSSKVKVLAGIVLLTGARMATFMNENIPGMAVPQNLIAELEAAPKGGVLSKGIEIAGRLIKQIREEKICEGVHIMAIGREEKVPDILAAAT